MPLKPRVHEWMLAAYFAYVVVLSPFFPSRPGLIVRTLWILLAVCGGLYTVMKLEHGRLAAGMRIMRDWIPLLLTIVAFREMNYFAPVDQSGYDLLREVSWVRFDWIVLDGLKLRAIIESLGPVIPLYLELCYLLVYGIGIYCVAVLSELAGRKAINRFWTIYLLGTLGSYVLFPFFPTEPPRLAFPDISPPTVVTWLRELNTFVLGQTTIRTSVFPSAHVSSVFAAAFAMIYLLPKGRKDGRFLLLYAFSVAVATVYGRYHYIVDVMAGFAVSLLAAALCLVYLSRDVKEKPVKIQMQPFAGT
jgi:membrane-associated phospholipid phosphatase